MRSLKEMTDLFFRALRNSMGIGNPMADTFNAEEWVWMWETARQQSLLSILFHGIEKGWVPKPERSLLLRWYVVSEQIKTQNMQVNRATEEVTNLFAASGYRSCVLKGQGNVLNYPDAYMRTSGDIDLWVEGGEEKVLRFVRSTLTPGLFCYHHIDAGVYGGVEVEVHYRPSFMNNLIHNKRLQFWFEEQADEQFSHEVYLPDGDEAICVPTHAFNRIYQLAHIYHHLIHEGIGLRQIIDYYFVLKQGFSEEERVRDGKLLKHFGLYKIASAMMWVLKETLWLDEIYWLVEPNEKLGRFLLDEIMLSGNFGQYDPRVKHGVSQWEKNLQRLKRDWRLVWYFPSECLWEPVFRWYHFFWRLRHK